MVARLPLVLVVLLFADCQSPPPALPDLAPPPGALFPARDFTANPAVFTLTGASEIDAIGDLHGDLDAALRMLVAAGVMSRTAPYHWTGGTRVVVIPGDVIDKGTAAIPVIDILRGLEPEARAAGGALVVTLGNHEAEFIADPTGTKASEFQAELLKLGLDPGQVAMGTSVYGEWLLDRPVAALVDGWFFCHAGDTGGKSVSAIASRFRDQFLSIALPGQTPFTDSYLVKPSSLLEARSWWTGPNPQATIDAMLAALPAKHLVFGHEPGAVSFPDDPQGDRKKGMMVARYAGRLFLIDTGMSYAVGYSTGAFMRVVPGPNETATAVFPDGTTRQLWP